LSAGVVLTAVVPTRPAQALAEIERYVFAASLTAPEVAVIDSTSDAVVARPGAPRHLLVSPGMGKLIASESTANRVDIVNLAELTVEWSIEPGFPPLLMQLDRAGKLLAIGDGATGHIVLVSLGDGTSRMVQGPANLSSLVFDRNGERLFTVSRTSASLFILDIKPPGAISEVAPGENFTAGSGIAFFAADPGGEYGFAADGESGLVSVVDLKQRHWMAGIALPAPAGRIFPKADSQSVFVASGKDQSISRISTWTLRESARLPVGSDIAGLSFGFFQTVAFALSRGENRVVAYDLDRPKPVLLHSIALPGRPESSTTSADGLKLYVALGDAGQVAVIDVRKTRLVKLIPDVEPTISAVVSANQDNYCH
jgi:DNA-binding beta-propeller fold protein YncE